jgi:hypothetical protein
VVYYFLNIIAITRVGGCIYSSEHIFSMIMKKRNLQIGQRTIALTVCFIFIIGVLVFDGFKHILAADTVQNCSNTKINNQVFIMNNATNPYHTDAHLCDTLTIVNQDNKERFVAFGNHQQHVPYDGVLGKELKQGDSLTVTLNKTGSFHFHDHTNDEADGTFTVTK